MKTVLLLFSSARSSIPLIRYMLIEGRRYGWKTCVGSMFDSDVLDQIKQEKFSNDVVLINITGYRQCDHAIRKADLVVGMLPGEMLVSVADLCIANKKSFITPARLNRGMVRTGGDEILLLSECGFAPGLDHITAKKAIDNIRQRGGEISAFRSYHGSILADSSIDNPWEYRLTELATDLLQMGRQDNRHLLDGKVLHIPYHHLFERAEPISIGGLKDLVVIPEGDALHARKIYGLEEAHTVMKGRIIRSGFEKVWSLLIKLGFTDTQSKIDMLGQSSYYNFLDSLLPYPEDGYLEHRLQKYTQASGSDIMKLRWIGLFDDDWINIKEPTPAMLLQHLLERKLPLRSDDRDCLLMEHHLEYTVKDVKYKLKATMVSEGENRNDSATAKAVGLTAGAAAKAYLLDNIKVKGFCIPNIPQIYDPILNELVDLGVAFHFEESKVSRQKDGKGDHAEETRIGAVA